ncbi:MAG: FMN-binding protein [Bacteroidales bacterium]|nr:FMN-binding protein [Bacteroidales bacterium]
MKLNTNSNVYTVVYATVLTVLVAVLLTVAAVGLKPQQQANADNEKKQQVLSAVSSVLGKEITFTNAADEWSALDMQNNMFLVNTKGEQVEGDAFAVVPKAQFAKGVVKEEATLPVYVANIAGKPYYIMCMYGAGLWDAIWGYIAVEADGSTIAGATFDHKGETAGLGAKIKDDPEFAKKFAGMQVFVNGAFKPVAISKKGGENIVDAITGATKTCDGVSAMIENSLKGYEAFLAKLQGGSSCQHACKKACGGEHKCQHGEGACGGEHKCQKACGAEAEAPSCCAEQQACEAESQSCCGEKKCNNNCEKVAE